MIIKKVEHYMYKDTSVLHYPTNICIIGQYVIKHHTLPNVMSRVLPPESMALTFNLTLMWGQQRFDSPHQLWRATSSFNLKVLYLVKYVYVSLIMENYKCV